MHMHRGRAAPLRHPDCTCMRSRYRPGPVPAGSRIQRVKVFEVPPRVKLVVVAQRVVEVAKLAQPSDNRPTDCSEGQRCRGRRQVLLKQPVQERSAAKACSCTRAWEVQPAG